MQDFFDSKGNRLAILIIGFAASCLVFWQLLSDGAYLRPAIGFVFASSLLTMVSAFHQLKKRF